MARWDEIEKMEEGPEKNELTENFVEKQRALTNKNEATIYDAINTLTRDELKKELRAMREDSSAAEEKESEPPTTTTSANKLTGSDKKTAAR